MKTKFAVVVLFVLSACSGAEGSGGPIQVRSEPTPEPIQSTLVVRHDQCVPAFQGGCEGTPIAAGATDQVIMRLNLDCEGEPVITSWTFEGGGIPVFALSNIRLLAPQGVVPNGQARVDIGDETTRIVFDEYPWPCDQNRVAVMADVNLDVPGDTWNTLRLVGLGVQDTALELYPGDPVGLLIAPPRPVFAGTKMNCAPAQIRAGRKDAEYCSFRFTAERNMTLFGLMFQNSPTGFESRPRLPISEVGVNGTWYGRVEGWYGNLVSFGDEGLALAEGEVTELRVTVSTVYSDRLAAEDMGNVFRLVPDVAEWTYEGGASRITGFVDTPRDWGDTTVFPAAE